MRSRDPAQAEKRSRRLAYLLFPLLYAVLWIGMEMWGLSQPPRSGWGMTAFFVLMFTVPAVLIYLAMLRGLRRWLRPLTTPQVFAFSILCTVLIPVTTGLALWLLLRLSDSGSVVADSMFFWFGPIGPSLIATTASMAIVKLVTKDSTERSGAV